MSSKGSIRPGALFASDYRIERVLCAERPGRAYLAVETETNQRVRIVELPASQSLAWATAAVEHPALAEFLVTVSVQNGTFGVFEDVPGTRVSAQIAKLGPLGAIDAVRTALRVAEGLTVLHRAGLTHGAVSPDNVVLEPDRSSGMILLPGSASSRPAGYRAPDRAEAELAPEDDLWATGALLYEMLTGSAPPTTGVSAPEQLQDAGIEEDVLGGIVAQALAADPNRRSARIASMRHPLGCWLERNEHEPEAEPGSRRYAWSRAVLPSSRPPPRFDSDAPEIEVGEAMPSEPPPDADKPAQRDSHRPELIIGKGNLSEPPPDEDAAPDEKDARPARVDSNAGVTREPAGGSSNARLGLGLAAAVVVAGAAFLLLRHPTTPAAHRTPVRTSAHGPVKHTRNVPSHAKPPPATPPTAATAATAAPSASAAAAHESVATCIGRHLPAFSFAKAPDLDWVCQTTDPRPGGQRLHRDVVKAADGKSITPAMQLFSPLTWYGMAEFAALRGVCCPDAAPLTLPAPSMGCQSIAAALNGLAAQVSEGNDPEQQLHAFSSGVSCELGHKQEAHYWQKGRPDGSEPHEFEKLLENVMHPRSAP